MKREKKEAVNRVVYFKDSPPNSAVFIAVISKTGIVHLIERIQGKDEREIITFGPNSFEPNKIYNTLKECHKKIGSRKTLYAQMPAWMIYSSSPQNTITEIM